MNEDRASKYQRLKRTSGIVSFAWSAVLLALLLLTGASAALRDLAQSSGAWAPQAVRATTVAYIYVALLMIVNELGGLPLSFYGGFLLERRYGLSNQRLAGWLVDQAKGFVVSLVLGRRRRLDHLLPDSPLARRLVAARRRHVRAAHRRTRQSRPGAAAAALLQCQAARP